MSFQAVLIKSEEKSRNGSFEHSGIKGRNLRNMPGRRVWEATLGGIYPSRTMEDR